MIEKVIRLRGIFPRSTSIDGKNVRQAVVVVIKNGYAVSSGFDDVLLGIFAAGNIDAGQTGLCRDIFVMNNRDLYARRQRPGWHGFATRSYPLRIRTLLFTNNR